MKRWASPPAAPAFASAARPARSSRSKPATSQCCPPAPGTSALRRAAISSSSAPIRRKAPTIFAAPRRPSTRGRKRSFPKFPFPTPIRSTAATGRCGSFGADRTPPSEVRGQSSRRRSGAPLCFAYIRAPPPAKSHAMGDWIAFWDSEHTLYVRARHRDVRYRAIAEDIAAYVPSASAVVLDYGCGEALHADRIAAAARKLILVEAAPNLRAGLAARFKHHPRIEVLSPQDMRGLADRSIDLAVMNSVAQYLASSELSALLMLFRRLLTPGGLLDRRRGAAAYFAADRHLGA